jgi:hypothetical protein
LLPIQIYAANRVISCGLASTFIILAKVSVPEDEVQASGGADANVNRLHIIQMLMAHVVNSEFLRDALRIRKGYIGCL